MTNTGKTPRFYESNRTGTFQCNGRDATTGAYCNHVPLGTEDVQPEIDTAEIPW